MNVMRIAVTAVALAFLGTGSAQQPDASRTATPALDTSSCAALPSQQEGVSRYPEIAADCKAVATEPTASPDALAPVVLDEPEPVQSNRWLQRAGWTPMLVLAGMLALVAAIFVGMRRRSRDLDVV